MADRMTRFDAELFDAAVSEGRRENRSARQQLEHWTRVGRMFSAHETSTRRRIETAVAGQMPLPELNPEERLVANVELDVAVREAAAGARFGQTLLDQGLPAVALDDDGNLIEFRPDGTRHPAQPGKADVRPVSAG